MNKSEPQIYDEVTKLNKEMLDNLSSTSRSVNAYSNFISYYFPNNKIQCNKDFIAPPNQEWRRNHFQEISFTQSFLAMMTSIPSYVEANKERFEIVMNESDFKEIEHLTENKQYKGFDIRFDNLDNFWCFLTAKNHSK